MKKNTSRHRQPAMLFYTGDWLKDPAVRCLSLEARGLWFEMICLMHNSPIRGHLSLGSGKPVSPKQLARMVGASEEIVVSLLCEMDDCGVYSVASDGVIYSRRMVLDEEERLKKSKAGKASAESRWGATPVTEECEESNTSDADGVTSLKDKDKDKDTIDTTIIKHNSSKNYLAQRRARSADIPEIQIVLDGIPTEKINNPVKTRVAIESALDRAKFETLERRLEGAKALSERIGAYYRSVEGSGQYFKAPHNWLDDDCHLADPASWNARDKEPEVTGWDSIKNKG